MRFCLILGLKNKISQKCPTFIRKIGENTVKNNGKFREKQGKNEKFGKHTKKLQKKVKK